MESCVLDAMAEESVNSDQLDKDKKCEKLSSTACGDSNIKTDVEKVVSKKNGATESETICEVDKVKDKTATVEKSEDIDDPAIESDSMIQLTLEEGENFQDEEIDKDFKNTSEVSPDVKDTKDTSYKNQDATKLQRDNTDKAQGRKKGGTLAAVENSNNKTSAAGKSKKKCSQSRNLWVTNIAHTTKATELKHVLSAYGKVIGAKVVINAKQPKGCCYGYVTMDTVEDANNCIAKLNNTELNGYKICIEKVRPDHLNTVQLNSKMRSLEDAGHHKSRRPDQSDEAVKNNKKDDSNKDDKAKGSSSKSPTKSGSKLQNHGRSPEGSQHNTNSRGSHKQDSDILTYEQIKEKQEKQRHQRQVMQEENRRCREEDKRLKEVDRMQRSEAQRLEREREKLRVEREKIAREKAELIRHERERQKLEREKLELEKLELQHDKARLQQQDCRSIKRPSNYQREDDYDDRKRIASDRTYKDSLPKMHFDPPRMSREREAHYNEQEQGHNARYISIRDDREHRSLTDHKIDLRSASEHRYVESKDTQHFERSIGSNNWVHSGGVTSNKPFNTSGDTSLSSKPWSKEFWKPSESSNSHRWNSENLSRMATQGNSNTNLGSSCSPGPVNSTFSGHRFDYKSMGRRPLLPRGAMDLSTLYIISNESAFTNSQWMPPRIFKTDKHAVRPMW
ncbi:hypothetical protein FQA39_LY15029 [Lamprigera yunnana]|nr:hypothetical protein FQA39_LY15029 [Lamprigera yunnana]